VTASHNTVKYNGWKGMLGNNKPGKNAVQAISDGYWQRVDSGLVIPDYRQGEAIDGSHLLGAYADKVVADIESQFGERPLDGKLMAYDGANGAASSVAPMILRRLGATVETYACDPATGLINDGCGANHLGGLNQFLEEREELTSQPNFIGAVLNDGDADRNMAMGVGRSGLVVVCGNHGIYAMAQGEPGTVGTEYTNTAAVNRLRKEGIEFEYCENGDVNVTEALRVRQEAGDKWHRGGEFSGHHVDTDWGPSGDGVRNAAWLAAFAVREGVTFGDMHAALPLWAEAKATVAIEDAERRKAIKTDPVVAEIMAWAREELGPESRVIDRASGTEPVYRLWAEVNGGEAVLPGVLARIHDVVAERAAA
jgi:phosphoglucosamine mutase